LYIEKLCKVEYGWSIRCQKLTHEKDMERLVVAIPQSLERFALSQGNRELGKRIRKVAA
jgi:hypothetical protein